MKAALWILSPLIVAGIVCHFAARAFRLGWRAGEAAILHVKGL